MKMRKFSFREANKIVRKNGFKLVGVCGSHFKYQRDGQTIVLNRNLQAPVFQRIMKENNLIICKIEKERGDM